MERKEKNYNMQQAEDLLTDDSVVALAEHYFAVIKDSDEVFRSVTFSVNPDTKKLKNRSASILFTASYNVEGGVKNDTRMCCEGTLYLLDKKMINGRSTLVAMFINDKKHIVVCSAFCESIDDLVTKLDKYIISFVTRSCRRAMGLEVLDIPQTPKTERPKPDTTKGYNKPRERAPRNYR